MGSSQLTLDQLWSTTSTFSITWSERIESPQAHWMPHSVCYRLYHVSRGNLNNIRLPVAQTTLAHTLDMSRHWVGERVSRFDQDGS